MKKNITDEPIALKEFYANNNESIKITYTNFFREIKDMYFANKPDIKMGDGYIGTSFAEEQGYMHNKREVINIGRIRFFISYEGKITREGQEYLLDYFGENQQRLEEKYNGRK